MKLPTLINTEEHCDALFEMLAGEMLVALDTEFVWTRSYFPFVGVIQIGVSPQKSFIIDAAVLQDCPKSFADFLKNEQVMKVCHDAYQDVQILNYYANTTTKNVLDSQLAASFLGFGRSISLSSLVENMFGKTLDKSEQRANWIKRPLSKAQIKYALDDVHYLTDCAKILIEKAKENGVWDWILEECAELSEIDEPFDLLSAVEKSYAKEVRMVTYKNYVKLYRLCYVTENMARKRNLPRSFLFKTGQLAEIINCNMENPANIQKTTLSPKMQKDYAQFFADTLNDTSIPIDQHLVNQPLYNKNYDSEIIGTLTKEISDILEKAANEKGICTTRIYNKKQLTDLVKCTLENKKAAQLNGWRNVFFGEIWNDFWNKKHNLERIVI